MPAKKKIYLLVLAVCLVDVLLFSLVLLPLSGRVKANSDNLNTQKISLAVLAAQGESLGNFQKNVDDLENYSRLVRSVFIDASAPVEFIEFLEDQAENYHLQLIASPFDSPPIKGDLWSSIGTRVNVEGQLADCLRFVEMLESSQWAITIVSFNLQKVVQEEEASDSGAVPRGEASLSLEIKAFSGQPPVLKKN